MIPIIEDKNKENVYKLLVEVFESSILEPDFTDLIKILRDLYASFSGQGFESSFEDILMLSLSESKRSNDVRKIFRFIADIVVALDNEHKAQQDKNGAESPNDEDDSEIVHPLLKYLFQTLEKWSKASSFIVRYRSCQLLYAVLSNIQDKGVGEIDSATYENIEALIQQRRIDVSSTVRAHAVLLAKFFQDPSSHNDPVIAGLCWQLQNDPNAHVRQNIVDIIAACEETIIPITNRFLYDKNANVRNAALLHICSRISVRSYSDYQQVVILKHCFSDSSGLVRRNAEERLIPIWFRTYGDKLCVFLSHLRLGNYSLDRLPFMEDLITILFRSTKIAQLLDEIDLDVDLFPKMPLTGERVFLWHYFYIMAQKEERIARYIPKQEDLIQFILKCFYDLSMTDDKACILNELITFAMDITENLEEENREKLVSLPSHILKNPFLPCDVIPYAVSFFSEYATKADGQSINDILHVMNDLQKMSELASEEGKNEIILKCLAIISAVLARESLVLSKEDFVLDKSRLIAPYLNSDDADVKKEAFKAFSLYCLLDLDEARKFWPLLMSELHVKSSLKLTTLECVFDILLSHGPQLFSAAPDQNDNEFIEALENLLPLAEENSYERMVIMEGILKLYLQHHTWSPILLAKLMLPMFAVDEYHSEKLCIEKFLRTYGEARLEAECLTKAFLSIINYLFESNKSDSLHKINIKTVALQLLEFSKSFEESPDCAMEDKFKDLLILRLTRKFLKKPGRISSLDLQDICNRIMPTDLQKLVKLEGNIKLVIKSLQSPVLLQTNPYLKKSMNFFTNYLKKIQIAINAAPILHEDKTERSKVIENENLQKLYFKRFPNELKTGAVNEHEKTLPLLERSLTDSKTKKTAEDAETGTSFSARLDCLESKTEDDNSSILESNIESEIRDTEE